MSWTDAELRAVAARVTAPGGLAHANDLVPLLEAVSSRSLALGRRVAVIETLQAVFTQLWHDGHLTGGASAASSSAAAAAADASSAAGGAGKKRKRPEEAAALSVVARWLKDAFHGFLDSLLGVLATPQGELARQEEKLRAEGGAKAAASSSSKKAKRAADADADSSSAQSPDDAAVSLRVAALAGAMHFLAHAVPSATQEAQGGQYFCYSLLLWFLRRMLAVDPLGGGSAGGSAGSAPYTKAQAKALGSAMTAFITGYATEWDDLRYYACRAVAQLAGETAAASSASASTVTTGASAVFARNAADLLLSLSLPASHAEWSDPGTEHGSWVRAQWDEDLPAVYAAADARLAAATEAAAAGAKKAAGGSDSGGISAAALASMGLGDDDGEGVDDDLGGPPAPVAAAGSKRKGGAAAASDAGAPPKAVADATPKYFLLAEQRRAFSDAWVALLRRGAGSCGGLPPDVTRRVLLALPGAILPHMPDKAPLLLADFLVATVDAGVGGGNGGSALDLTGATTTAAAASGSGASSSAHPPPPPPPGAAANAVLALAPLFTLMQGHGLEYPRFYGALYALVTPSTLAARHRGRLFRLLDLCLSSVALPAYLVAAFMKRLARLALTSPPPVALFVLPLLQNCAKRHPAVTPLLHRAATAAGAAAGAPDGGKAGGKKGAAAVAWPAGGDPFDAATPDYASCGALQSSLWEVVSLSNHYLAPVAHAARALMAAAAAAATAGPAGGKPEVDVSDPRVSGSTYGSLVGDEARRTVSRGGARAPPPVPFAFGPPPPGGFFGGATGGAVDFSA